MEISSLLFAKRNFNCEFIGGKNTRNKMFTENQKEKGNKKVRRPDKRMKKE